jgi:hypothetical protein
LPIDPAGKERLAFVQILLLQPASHSLAGLLGDLELNGSAGAMSIKPRLSIPPKLFVSLPR